MSRLQEGLTSDGMNIISASSFRHFQPGIAGLRGMVRLKSDELLQLVDKNCRLEGLADIVIHPC